MREVLHAAGRPRCTEQRELARVNGVRELSRGSDRLIGHCHGIEPSLERDRRNDDRLALSKRQRCLHSLGLGLERLDNRDVVEGVHLRCDRTEDRVHRVRDVPRAVELAEVQIGPACDRDPAETPAHKLDELGRRSLVWRCALTITVNYEYSRDRDV